MIEKKMVIAPEYGEMLINSNPNNRNVSARSVEAKAKSFRLCGAWVPTESLGVELVGGHEILRSGMGRLRALREIGWPQSGEFAVRICYFAEGEWRKEWSVGVNCSQKNTLSDDLKMAYGEICKKGRRTVCSSIHGALTGQARGIDVVAFREMNTAIGDLLDAYVVESQERGNPAPLSAGFILWDILNDGRNREKMVAAKEEIRLSTGHPILSKIRDYARENCGGAGNNSIRAWVFCWAAEMYARSTSRMGKIVHKKIVQEVMPYRDENIELAGKKYAEILEKSKN